MRRRLTSLLLLLALTLSSAVASAQQAPDAADDREARGLFEAGREAFGAARYERALDYFRQSYALSRRPALLYNIAQSADRLRRDRDALEAFEQFLSAVPNAPERPAVEERIAFLRDAVATEAAATNAARASGANASASRDRREPPSTSPGPGPLPWVLTIAGGALTAVGVVSLVLASSAAADVRDAEPGTPWTDLEGSYARSGALGWLGGALLAGGTALAGLGIVLLLTSSGPAEESAQAGASPPIRLTLLPNALLLSGGWR